ncbi:MAG TPA: tRNA pseudouridine(55) synthase TruB [Candidatus Vogelbacteria bacterium]|nr:tRNA pseudouridine(55) synthase TruB [Candidatus Vogelbacteria bacterium]
MDNLEGKILAIWKPKGPTSHDVVDMLRQKTGLKRIGHAGTLDPLAEGILVVGFGRQATRELGKIIVKDKEYQANIVLGIVSETFDAEGPLKEQKITAIPSLAEIEKIIKEKFIGLIEQVPPAHSALKIGGRRAYKIKRSGEEPKMKTRKVYIEKIKIIDYSFPSLTLHISCGTGTYIRSLAHDLGQELGIGGYLAGLTRLRVGEFLQNQALTIEQVVKEYKI